ncbi:MAG: hypothetical protein Q6368_003545 [Candidatus Baldrarchaeota archaeon]
MNKRRYFSGMFLLIKKKNVYPVSGFLAIFLAITSKLSEAVKASTTA